jgi:hypothetical protein
MSTWPLSCTRMSPELVSILAEAGIVNITDLDWLDLEELTCKNKNAVLEIMEEYNKTQKIDMLPSSEGYSKTQTAEKNIPVIWFVNLDLCSRNCSVREILSKDLLFFVREDPKNRIGGKMGQTNVINASNVMIALASFGHALASHFENISGALNGDLANVGTVLKGKGGTAAAVRYHSLIMAELSIKIQEALCIE